MRLLDLFCGRWGWSRAFAARGWECIGIDLVSPPEVPVGCKFINGNVLDYKPFHIHQLGIDFIVASPPCEQFSVHKMPHFFPNPPYPELGIELFNHTRELCEASGLSYVIENVKAAEMFVGKSVHHCGPFHLWGSAVPPLMNQGIKKLGRGNGNEWRKFKDLPPEERKIARNQSNSAWPTNKKECARRIAIVPPELASCVADYAERLLEQRKTA